MASNIDWEAIEREYRAGQLSVREIAQQHGVSHTAINKRAKAEGWLRNLAQKVREEVSNRLVSTEVSSAQAREAVETAVRRGVEVVRQHRGSLGRMHRIAELMMAELEHGTENAGEIEALIEAETAEDRSANRRNAMLKAVSLPSRASTLRELSQTLKNLIPLERQAFNLDDPGGDEPATKNDTRTILARLDASQRNSLRGIAEALAGGPGGAPAGA
jgi:hypothetical protein